MKQTTLVTLAATALIGLSACKGGSASTGGKLIPEQATIMAGIDVAGLMKTKSYSDNKAMLEKQREWTEVSAAAKACNLDPEKALSSVLLGTDGKAGFAVVITGEGLGDEKNLNCVADKAKEKNGGKTPFTIADDGGKKVLRMDGGDGTGYIVDGKTVVFASKSWEAAVKELIDGKGKAAIDGPNKDLFARADQSKHIWAAGLLPADAAGAAKGMGADAKDFSISLDLADGMSFAAAVGVASADQAKELKKKADEGLAALKGLAPMLGIPAKAVETLKVDTKDNQITVSASMSQEDVKQLQDKAGAMMGGMGGMGGPPPMEMAAPPVEAPPADPAEPAAPADPAAPAAPAP
ncbi:MAG: hypothetical protein H0T76_03750 [Nannocystis sp.]|nr:hypothetical protein [Nannocystis sp.]MBA3545576.1 hypothetical protein [Nannocystis sp.]